MLARSRARFRIWARRWSAKLKALLPQPAERELFSRRVRRRLHSGVTCDAASGEHAARLLSGRLTEAQRRCLRRRDFFAVEAKSGRKYRLWARRQFPVELIDDRGPRRRHAPWLYCVEAGRRLPLADQMLALKLCLEADEDHFLIAGNPNFAEGMTEKAALVRKAAAQG